MSNAARSPATPVPDFASPASEYAIHHESREHREQRDRDHDGGDRVGARQRRRAGRAVDLDRHRVAAGAAREVVADHEIVDRDRKHDRRAGDDRRQKQREQHLLERHPGVAPRSAAGFFVRSADREQPTAHDHHHVGDREGHVPEDLRERAGVDEGEQVREHQKQRHAHDDLGGHQREQHQEVRRRLSRGRASGPSPSARATPMGVAIRTSAPASLMLW